MRPEKRSTAGRKPRAASRFAPFGRRLVGWVVVLAAGGALSAAVSPAPVAAPPFHTALEASFPAADSVYRQDVREVRLRYSTAVQLALSTLVVVRSNGASLATGPLETVPASEEREIRAPFAAPLPSGIYTVRWTTAGPDSHPLSGAFSFRVDVPAAPPTPSPEVATGEPRLTTAVQSEDDAEARDPVGALLRSLFLLYILGMLGTSVFRLAVLEPLSEDPPLEPTVRLAASHTRGLAAAAAGLAFASVPMRLWKQSADLFGANALGADSLSRIIGSSWGTAWMLQAAMAALFVAGLVGVGQADRRTRGWWIMLAAALGSAVVPALSGHAADSAGESRVFALLNDTVHVTAAGVWMGTLAVLLIVGIPAALVHARPEQSGDAPTRGPDPVRASGDPIPPATMPPLARMVNAFSRIALIAVGALVVTGLVNAWLRLRSLDALLGSAYGLTLLAKLTLVAAAASVGLFNWRVVRPALAEGEGAGRLRTSVGAETILGLLIVLVTAILIATPLPNP
jgi:putative copper export protein/methionine-rich copper-binding protein CopC